MVTIRDLIKHCNTKQSWWMREKPHVCYISVQKLWIALLQWDDCVFWSLLFVCPDSIPANGGILLLENVAPSRSDKVPSQRHPYDIIGNCLDGGDGILLADLGWVKSVIQVPGPGKSKTSWKSNYLDGKHLSDLSYSCLHWASCLSTRVNTAVTLAAG